MGIICPEIPLSFPPVSWFVNPSWLDRLEQSLAYLLHGGIHSNLLLGLGGLVAGSDQFGSLRLLHGDSLSSR